MFHVDNYIEKCPAEIKTIGLSHSMCFKNQLHIFTSQFLIQICLAPQSNKVMGLALRKAFLNPLWTHQRYILPGSTFQLAFVFDHHCHLKVLLYRCVFLSSSKLVVTRKSLQRKCMFFMFTELDISSRTMLFSIIDTCGYGTCEI